MNRNVKYICIEGVEGVGKTTQVKMLEKFLKSKNLNILATKEPGTPHLPVTMDLRNFMLNKEYEDSITPLAREYISQAIRSIHINNLILPTINAGNVDFIIQDRGLLSGLAYGEACGHTHERLAFMMRETRGQCPLYDMIIIYVGDVKSSLERAQQTKQEFAKGDVIESKGSEFMKIVSQNMFKYKDLVTTNTVVIDITNKSIEEVAKETQLVLEKWIHKA